VYRDITRAPRSCRSCRSYPSSFSRFTGLGRLAMLPNAFAKFQESVTHYANRGLKRGRAATCEAPRRTECTKPGWIDADPSSSPSASVYHPYAPVCRVPCFVLAKWWQCHRDFSCVLLVCSKWSRDANIRRESNLARLLHAAFIIIWMRQAFAAGDTCRGSSSLPGIFSWPLETSSSSRE